jgi:hypothetical protein
LDSLAAFGDLLFETLDEFLGLLVLVHQVLLDGCWLGGGATRAHQLGVQDA